MEWARAHGHRADNPADSRLDGALPANGHKAVHREALNHSEVPEAFAKVMGVEGSQRGAALGLALLMLTGTRRDEAREATWGEVDFDAMVWTIPAVGRRRAGRIASR